MNQKKVKLLACVVDGKAQIIVGNELPRVAESDVVFRSPSCACGSRLAITSKDKIKEKLHQRLADLGLLCYYLVAKEEMIAATEGCDIAAIEVIIDGDIVVTCDKKTGKYVKKIKECSI